jgi:hypothetical protein
MNGTMAIGHNSMPDGEFDRMNQLTFIPLHSIYESSSLVYVRVTLEGMAMIQGLP